MSFEVLAPVIEQFWNVCWISYCKKYLVSKGVIFYTVLLQIYLQMLAKTDMLDLSLIKLLQK